MQIKSGANDRAGIEQIFPSHLSNDCRSMLKKFHSLEEGSLLYSDYSLVGQNFEKDLPGPVLNLHIPNVWKALKLHFIRI